jgi:WD40 repeat protein
MLTEVLVGDEPPDDDSSSVWTDDDNVEEVHEDDQGDSAAGPSDLPDVAVACFAGHSDCVYCAAVHPTQAGIVLTGMSTVLHYTGVCSVTWIFLTLGGGDDVAFLWTYDIDGSGNEELGRAVKTCTRLTGHSDTVTSVGFNFDGSLALTGAYDGKVQIWNVSNGSLLQVLEGPEGYKIF